MIINIRKCNGVETSQILVWFIFSLVYIKLVYKNLINKRRFSAKFQVSFLFPSFARLFSNHNLDRLDVFGGEVPLAVDSDHHVIPVDEARVVVGVGNLGRSAKRLALTNSSK